MELAEAALGSKAQVGLQRESRRKAAGTMTKAAGTKAQLQKKVSRDSYVASAKEAYLAQFGEPSPSEWRYDCSKNRTLCWAFDCAPTTMANGTL